MAVDDDEPADLEDLTRQLIRTSRAMREALDRGTTLSDDLAADRVERRVHGEQLDRLERALRGDGNGDKGIIARLIRLEGDVKRIVDDLGRNDDRRFQVGLMIGGTFLTAIGALVLAVFKH